MAVNPIFSGKLPAGQPLTVFGWGGGKKAKWIVGEISTTDLDYVFFTTAEQLGSIHAQPTDTFFQIRKDSATDVHSLKAPGGNGPLIQGPFPKRWCSANLCLAHMTCPDGGISRCNDETLSCEIPTKDTRPIEPQAKPTPQKESN